MDKDFGGVIWTKHALDKLNERGISPSDAWATWRNPEQSKKARVPGAWVYYKTYGSQKIEVVAKKNPSTSSGQAGEWVILSVWSRPVYGKQGKIEPFWKFLMRQIFRG